MLGEDVGAERTGSILQDTMGREGAKSCPVS
jgi:hypothetical protein